jgi:hypothetical protein
MTMTTTQVFLEASPAASLERSMMRTLRLTAVVATLLVLAPAAYAGKKKGNAGAASSAPAAAPAAAPAQAPAPGPAPTAAPNPAPAHHKGHGAAASPPGGGTTATPVTGGTTATPVTGGTDSGPMVAPMTATPMTATPAAGATGTTTSTATTTDLYGTSTVTATPGSSAPRFDVAGRIGLVGPTNRLHLFAMPGIELGYLTPLLGHRLLFALNVSWTRPSYTTTGQSDPSIQNGANFTSTIHEDELVVGLDASYRLRPPDATLNFFAGLQPLLYLLRASETNTFDPGVTNTNQGTKIGVGYFIGADYRLGPGMLTGELRVLYSYMDHKLTGEVNLGNIILSVGYRMLF